MKLDYDEISPFTGNKSVLIESDASTNIESRICMDTGYTTRDVWQIGSKNIKLYEKGITQLMIDTKFEDHLTGFVWYLTSMITPQVMLYPKGTHKDNWNWEVTPVIPIVGEERKKFPVPDKEDEYFTTRLAPELAQSFQQLEFKQAMEAFYATLNPAAHEEQD